MLIQTYQKNMVRIGLKFEVEASRTRWPVSCYNVPQGPGSYSESFRSLTCLNSHENSENSIQKNLFILNIQLEILSISDSPNE